MTRRAGVTLRVSVPPVTSPWVTVRSFPRLALALLCSFAAVGTAACGSSSADAGASAPASSSPALVPGALLHGPLGCPSATAVLVLQRVLVDLGTPATVVVARCDSGAGSPPSGVYVVAGDDAAAHVTATLVSPADAVQVSGLSTTGGVVTVTGRGYSTPDVPRCCPDTDVALRWHVVSGQLVRVG